MRLPHCPSQTKFAAFLSLPRKFVPQKALTYFLSAHPTKRSEEESLFLSSMDFHLKQWTAQNEADEQQSAKIPKLLLDPQHLPETASSGLNLFLPHPGHTTQMNVASGSSPFPDLASASTRFYRIGSYFSASQLQELELQALIFRYMVSGAPVPAELLQPIKKSLFHAPSYFLHYPHWGRRASMDPEPGRCRRTDGKKWRCSREVVGGQKYCERHVHRGRNRSRKPVEVSAPGSAASGGRIDPVGGGSPCRIGSNSIVASQPLNTVTAGTRFTLSELSPAVDLFNLHASGYSSSGPEMEIKGLVESQNEVDENSCKSDGHVLRHFFDDWPRSLEETGNTMHGGNKNQLNSSTCLSISEPGNSPSDISLKLSTGNAGEQRGMKDVSAECNQEETPLSWSAIPTGQMGGPLAEALQPSSVTSFVGA